MPEQKSSLSMELLALWALFIVYGTILPFDLRFNMGTLSHGLAMANKYPWRVAGGGFPPTADLITNVLLFLPWGLLIGIHRRRGNWQLRQTLGYGLSTALAMSAAVEFLQLFSSYRYTSTTDLVTNGTGGLLGAGVGWWLADRLPPLLAPKLGNAMRQTPWAVAAIVVTVGIWIVAASPFDPSLNIEQLKASIQTMRPIPFGPSLGGPGVFGPTGMRVPELLWWSLAGGVFAAAASERRASQRRRWVYVLAATFVCASIAEAGQLLLRTRVSDATTVFMALAGGSLGAGLVFARRGQALSSHLNIAIILWAGAIVGGGLRPWLFHPLDVSYLSPWQLVPFMVHFVKTDVYALADTINQAIVFAPLGAYLALRPRPMSQRQAFFMGAAGGALIEAAQLFTVSRTADATDALLAGIGSAVGWWICRYGLHWRNSPHA